jgi:hypothetical protein
MWPGGGPVLRAPRGTQAGYRAALAGK